MLAPVQGKGFIVFHDAYQYFETRFNSARSRIHHCQSRSHARSRAGKARD